jgi:hypothetical protein
MGITNFYGWIRKEYQPAIKYKWLPEYDNVYIDLNYALHYVASSTDIKSEDRIYEKLYDFISDILKKTLPRKSVFLATDGIPPISKLTLQRKRRLCKSHSDTVETMFNTIQFTPGTKFMETLDTKMKPFFEKLFTFYNVNIETCFGKFDESEIKIKNIIMKRLTENSKETHIVVSNDADIVVMLMGVTDFVHLHRLFILNKTFSETHVIYLGSLITEHVKKVGCSSFPHLDFIACCLFLGNDYIPKVGHIDVDKLWLSYKDTVENIVPQGLISKPFKSSDKFSINRKFLIRMLYKCLCYSKQDIFKLDNKKRSFYNYFDGYTWCIDMYMNGRCCRYDYFYNKMEGLPQPFSMIIALEINPSLLQLRKSNNRESMYPLNKSLYSLLVMPKKYLYLVKENMDIYKKFIQKHTDIYKIENCSKCKKFKTSIEDKDNDCVLLKKQLITHKKSHTDITEEDIIKFNIEFKKYCSSL